MNQLNSQIVKTIKQQLATRRFGGHLFLTPGKYSRQDLYIIQNQLAPKGGDLEIRTIKMDDTKGSVWKDQVIIFKWKNEDKDLIKCIKQMINFDKN